MRDRAVQVSKDHTNILLIHIIARDRLDEGSGRRQQPCLEWELLATGNGARTQTPDNLIDR